MSSSTEFSARRWQVRVGTILLVLGAWLPGCTCGSKSSAVLECESDPDCPYPLVCDETQGLCVDDDGGTFMCSPPLPGCPCSSGDTATCPLEGTDPRVIAGCRHGEMTCVNDVFGACQEAIEPDCESVGVGPGLLHPNDQNSDQVVKGPEGELILDPDVKKVEFGYLWVANTGENTVSKLDVDTGREVARYASVKDSAAYGIPAVPLGGFNGDTQNCGNCPSRTAIDFKGDAFVANRAFGEQATVTKFANALEDCRDYDGDGMIETSTDVDGDGMIDVSDPLEFFGEADECILWTKPVGGRNAVARALAIDAGGPDGENGNVWVGLFNEQRIVALSGDTGDPILVGGQPLSVRLQMGGGRLSPYGAAVDGGANVWVTGLDDGDLVYLAKVNAFDGTLTGFYPVPDDDDGCSQSYGIAVDTQNRIWLGGWQCKDIKVFDPVALRFYRRDNDAETNTRGIAVDLAGHVWVAHSGGRVARYSQADVITLGDAAPATYFDMPPLPAGFPQVVGQTIGVGIDRNGACWAVSRNDGGLGMATRIKPDGTVQSFPVGKNPYTYSDFTGFGLSTVVRPNGFWRGVISGCARSTEKSDWKRLTWTEIQPAGTSVRMRVRVADTVDGLASAPWFGPWEDPPVDLDAAGVPDSFFLEAEAQLSTTDPAVRPAFVGFQVDFDCDSITPIP